MQNTYRWNLDSRSCHAVHPAGFYAYWDPHTTESGAVRLIGPFTAGGGVKLGCRVPIDLMRQLESSILPFDHYVLWGQSSGKVSCDQGSISILGSKLDITVEPTWRSTLLVSNSSSQYLTSDLSREWDYDAASDRLQHRAGAIIFFQPKNTEVQTIVEFCEPTDRSVFDPDAAKTERLVRCALAIRNIFLD